MRKIKFFLIFFTTVAVTGDVAQKSRVNVPISPKEQIEQIVSSYGKLEFVKTFAFIEQFAYHLCQRLEREWFTSMCAMKMGNRHGTPRNMLKCSRAPGNIVPT